MKIDNNDIGFSSIGERATIGTTVAGEDLWPGTAVSIPVPSGAGEQMTIVSTDAADNGTSTTGVLTLRIEYLDINGAQQTEDLIADGLTEVDTIATDITFINDMYALTVGSNGVAEGDISIYKKGASTTIYNMIETGGNKSLVSNRKVPTGKVFNATWWTCASSNNKDVSFRLRSNCTPDGRCQVEGFLFKRVARVRDSVLSEEIIPPIKICAGSLIKVSAWAVGGSGVGSCSFNGYLEDVT